jgi:hypothetical protein
MRMLTLTLRVILLLALALVSGHQAMGRALAGGAIATELCIDGSLVTVTLDARGNPVSHDHACPDCVLGGLAVTLDPQVLTPPGAVTRAVLDELRAASVHALAAPRPAARGPPAALAV